MYHKLLMSSYGFEAGDIAKDCGSTHSGNRMVLVPGRHSESYYSPYVIYSLNVLEPSTFAAYKRQHNL